MPWWPAHPLPGVPFVHSLPQTQLHSPHAPSRCRAYYLGLKLLTRLCVKGLHSSWGPWHRGGMRFCSLRAPVGPSPGEVSIVRQVTYPPHLQNRIMVACNSWGCQDGWMKPCVRLHLRHALSGADLGTKIQVQGVYLGGDPRNYWQLPLARDAWFSGETFCPLGWSLEIEREDIFGHRTRECYWH